MRVRIATDADASRIAELRAASWRVTNRNVLNEAYLNGEIMGERTAVWSRRLVSPRDGQRVILAETEGDVIGFACVYPYDDPEWGTLLDNLHIAQAFQYRGIGPRLMAEIAKIRRAEAANYGLYLWVLEPNLPARYFYKRLGAVKTGQDIWVAPDWRSIPRLRLLWKNLEPLIQLLEPFL